MQKRWRREANSAKRERMEEEEEEKEEEEEVEGGWKGDKEWVG